MRRCLLGIGLAVALIAVSEGRAADITTIAHGDRVNLQEHIDGSAYVLFDFYADWCAPCRALEPKLERLARGNPERLAIRKIDIINWQSPVVAQLGIRSIPHLKLYSPDGELIREGSADAVLAVLHSRLGTTGGGSGSAGGSSTGTVVGLVAVVALIAVGFAIARGSKRTVPDTPPPAPRPEPHGGPHGEWFVMLQGSLDGPYTTAQLRQLHHDGHLERSQRIRRKGDRNWTPLAEVLD
jgi:thiol-disulfide isomerase/thioredoxin